MPMTLDQIVDAWKRETQRRIREIESGEVKGIPGEAVSERIRSSIRR
jgi:putative addiction module component (TIGR02574 family)